ncbi:HAD family phosphatase [Nocardiopsis exhalans]|uniref:HAD family phosphatase n=1 Tax=Nocardiopsis exhalans TaxID=163604 RepID=A0ABY5D3D3_9ACTN|nr:HAD family phosphatase [Nocardiopsis exhalans]USY17697.1 HAD family phosphatase [Nocardiopsis exhalans]
MGLTRIDTVITDYGGVLTNPLMETLEYFSKTVGVTPTDLLNAVGAATERHGAEPMALLEVGSITEARMVELVSAELPGRERLLPEDSTFGEVWFAGRVGNEAFIEYLRGLSMDDYRLALLTNNVVEWEELWRATVPADELFDVVVNSAHEGVRKPAREIYEIVLERLGTKPERCVFVDDLEANLVAAAELGMATVHFRDNDQAAAELTELLEESGRTDGGAR